MRLNIFMQLENEILSENKTISNVMDELPDDIRVTEMAEIILAMDNIASSVNNPLTEYHNAEQFNYLVLEDIAHMNGYDLKQYADY